MKDICQQRITPQAIVATARRIVKEDNELYELVHEMEEEHVIVDLSSMHYGMKEHNPLKFVKFYSKRKPKRELSAFFNAEME